MKINEVAIARVIAFIILIVFIFIGVNLAFNSIKNRNEYLRLHPKEIVYVDEKIKEYNLQVGESFGDDDIGIDYSISYYMFKDDTKEISFTGIDKRSDTHLLKLNKMIENKGRYENFLIPVPLELEYNSEIKQNNYTIYRQYNNIKLTININELDNTLKIIVYNHKKMYRTH